MPDTITVERPVALKAPGSEFPEIKFRAETLKVTIAANFEMRSPEEVARVKCAIESAIKTLRPLAVFDAEGNASVTVNHVQG